MKILPVTPSRENTTFERRGDAQQAAGGEAAHHSPSTGPSTGPNTALAPVGSPARAQASYRFTRPNASFVTHLIAVSAQEPQTRVLRRAAPADASAAYHSASTRTIDVGLVEKSVLSRVA